MQISQKIYFLASIVMVLVQPSGLLAMAQKDQSPSEQVAVNACLQKLYEVAGSTKEASGILPEFKVLSIGCSPLFNGEQSFLKDGKEFARVQMIKESLKEQGNQVNKALSKRAFENISVLKKMGKVTFSGALYTTFFGSKTTSEALAEGVKGLVYFSATGGAVSYAYHTNKEYFEKNGHVNLAVGLGTIITVASLTGYTVYQVMSEQQKLQSQLQGEVDTHKHTINKINKFNGKQGDDSDE